MMAETADRTDVVLCCSLTGRKDLADVLSPTWMRYGFLITMDILSYTIALRNSRSAQQMLRRIKQQVVTHRDEDDTQPLCD